MVDGIPLLSDSTAFWTATNGWKIYCIYIYIYIYIYHYLSHCWYLLFCQSIGNQSNQKQTKLKCIKAKQIKAKQNKTK